MCRHTNYPSPGPHTGTLQWLKLLQHAAFSVMKHEPGAALALGSPGAGAEPSSSPAPRLPAATLQERLPDLPQLLPVPGSWLSPRTGTGIQPWTCPFHPHPAAGSARPLRIFGNPRAWDGRSATKWFWICWLVFFARTLIRCRNQRLKVTYTAIASHAEPNIHRRKYCINYNAEQHSISAIVPLQL